MVNVRYPEQLVFGLDIGTRSIVGTIGYKENEKKFVVIAQAVKVHETRAMLDGQIHDIEKVSESIEHVKKVLEKQIGRKLTDVCIAAAGRVLKTVAVKADFTFDEETLILEEHIHSLDLIGIEKAYETIQSETKQENSNFYCVAYTPIRYYMNDYAIMKLNGHKAVKISTELLATFLPYEVIDSLHSAVEKARLQVSNLTLEPIAAINVAIPEHYRLLNIALVDVGAGTSDISITKDGSIVAYGMIPSAGDELTEVLMQKYLVDFDTAESIKQNSTKKKTISYKDIMGISHKVNAVDVIKDMTPVMQKITKQIAGKIVDLNGGKSVSAVFVVGGGGKVKGFVKYLADYLKLPSERVALRGEEVLKDVDILQDGVKKDPLLVTPIGICLNYYDSKNNFIFVHVNEERVKLYDNSKLTIVDAALSVGFPNEKLFPKRGLSIEYTLNGKKRLCKGQLGEAAIVRLNGKIVGINTPISQHDIIDIEESTSGADAVLEIRNLPEYESTIEFIVNGKQVLCPKFVIANEKLVSEYYSIRDQDSIRILNYYTLEQVLDFMDIEYHEGILVNNKTAYRETKIYEKFSIDYNLEERFQDLPADESVIYLRKEPVEEESLNELQKEFSGIDTQKNAIAAIRVNGKPILLTGKPSYILVDVLDFYPVDLSVAHGSSLVTKIDGEYAVFTSPVENGNQVEIYWVD